MLLKILLLPLSALYGLVVGIRNYMYNHGILKSVEFDLPIICVGNLTVGGTGKTPHTELLIAELKKHYKVACLSRGYKRKTSGFILADKHSTAADIGDEPLQIKLKFPDIIVACDGDRVRGVNNLLQLKNRPEVIVLDDAFQHRHIKAGKSILLIDYNRLIYKDLLLPAGRLRERKKGIKRADYIIISKCPATITPIERRIILKHLKLKAYQKLFFTHTTYQQIKGLNPENIVPEVSKECSILCVTGIAKPEPYIEHLKSYTNNLHALRYPDHHAFSKKDIQHILSEFGKIENKEKYIFTTEKDAIRLMSTPDLPKLIRENTFYIPIMPSFIIKKEVFLSEINDYVRKNKKERGVSPTIFSK